MSTLNSDLAGYLDAFGVRCRVKGVEYKGIFDDDYEVAEFGRVRISSNAPDLLFRKSDVRQMSLAYDDQVSILDDELETWTTYYVKSQEPRTDGFVAVKMVE